MNRKNIIIISAVANAALLIILFITAVVSKEDRKSPSSVEVASSILEKNPDGMVLLPQESENNLGQKKDAQQPTMLAQTQASSAKELVPLAPNTNEMVANAPKEETLVHRLPEVASAESQQQPLLVNPTETAQEKSPVAQENSEKQTKEAFSEVVVKKGDSLDKIARRYHTSIREIKSANNLEGNFLKIGKVLRIPVKETALVKSSNKEELATAGEYYVIKHGDNPWTVAVKHHIKVEELLRLNHLTKEKAKKLRPGDKLRIR